MLLFAVIEVHFWICSNLFEHQSNYLLLLGRNKDGQFLINPNNLELAIRICSPSPYNNDLSLDANQ